MPVRPGVRFDAFRRDDFTCQYCGRKTPDVILEADHIIPRSQGGGDELDNLVTACVDCNRGKGAKTASPPAATDIAERAAAIREKEAQLRAYNEAKTEEKTRRDSELARAFAYWAENVGGYAPWPTTLRWAVDKLGIVEVEEAMDLAADRFQYTTARARRYFSGIVKRKVAEREGRVVKCVTCGDWIVLEPGENPASEWAHTGECSTKAGFDGA